MYLLVHSLKVLESSRAQTSLRFVTVTADFGTGRSVERSAHLGHAEHASDEAEHLNIEITQRSATRSEKRLSTCVGSSSDKTETKLAPLHPLCHSHRDTVCLFLMTKKQGILRTDPAVRFRANSRHDSCFIASQHSTNRERGGLYRTGHRYIAAHRQVSSVALYKWWKTPSLRPRVGMATDATA